MRAPRLRPSTLEWAVLAAGVYLTIAYAWILDDAYVYYRYIENFLAFDFGFVYNEGEYVEGYTSPLWLLVLTTLRGLGLDYWLMIRGLGVATFVVFWWGLVALDRDLAPASTPPGARGTLNVPLLLLATNYATLCYFTSGVEAPLANLAAVAYATYLVRPERRAAGLLVALSPLVRPELALALALAVVFVWARHGFPWRVVTTATLAIGGWLVFRVTYYADLLPNTFYLKHENLLAQGIAYLHQSLAAYGGYGLLVGGIVAVVALRRRGVRLEGWPRVAMLLIAVAVAAYVVRIGGDPRHHRYLAFAFCLALCATAGLAEQLVQTFRPGLATQWRLAFGLLVAVGSVALYPPQLSNHPLRSDVTHFPVALVNDAAFHRALPGLSPPAFSLAPLGTGLPSDLERTPADWQHGYARFDSSLWCYEHFWQLHHGITHGAGLTDAFLARTVARSGRPAHKPKLAGRARAISTMREQFGAGPGMFRRAIDAGAAPRWVAPNLTSLEQIERKVYNRHDFFENLPLALEPIAKIR